MQQMLNGHWIGKIMQL